MTLELPQDVEPQNVAPPVTFGNFAMPSGSYIPPKWGRETAKIPSRSPFNADFSARSGCASTEGGR